MFRIFFWKTWCARDPKEMFTYLGSHEFFLDERSFCMSRIFCWKNWIIARCERDSERIFIYLQSDDFFLDGRSLHISRIFCWKSWMLDNIDLTSCLTRSSMFSNTVVKRRVLLRKNTLSSSNSKSFHFVSSGTSKNPYETEEKCF